MDDNVTEVATVEVVDITSVIVGALVDVSEANDSFVGEVESAVAVFPVDIPIVVVVVVEVIVGKYDVVVIVEVMESFTVTVVVVETPLIGVVDVLQL